MHAQSQQHRRLSPDLDLGKSPGFWTFTCGFNPYLVPETHRVRCSGRPGDDNPWVGKLGNPIKWCKCNIFGVFAKCLEVEVQIMDAS
jgi:hypothetical protein